jgi:hypothetical protein
MTDKEKIDLALNEIVKLSGNVGYLTGRLDAHLINDHKYPKECFEKDAPANIGTAGHQPTEQSKAQG